jgi:hypothetical protein
VDDLYLDHARLRGLGLSPGSGSGVFGCLRARRGLAHAHLRLGLLLWLSLCLRSGSSALWGVRIVPLAVT